MIRYIIITIKDDCGQFLKDSITFFYKTQFLWFKQILLASFMII